MNKDGKKIKKLRVLLIVAMLVLMNIGVWVLNEHIFKDVNYNFASQQSEQEKTDCNEEVKAFSDKDEMYIENTEKIVDQKVSNGLDVTLCKIVGDRNKFYVIFEVEDPTGSIDFTKLENRPMQFKDSSIIFPETGEEKGEWCKEILEKRTPYKTQFMMECVAMDEITDKKISIILKDLVASFDQDIQPLEIDEKDLRTLYPLMRPNNAWMDIDPQKRTEISIHVMEASTLAMMRIVEDHISFSFSVPYRTTDYYLIDSFALRNKETGEVKIPSCDEVHYSDPNSKKCGKDFEFGGIEQEELGKWEMITGHKPYYTMITPGGWHFGLETNLFTTPQIQY